LNICQSSYKARTALASKAAEKMAFALRLANASYAARDARAKKENLKL
jgi:hypothetical protein